MPGVLDAGSHGTGGGSFAGVRQPRSQPSDNQVYHLPVSILRFKRPVEPGDQLVMDITMLRAKAGIYKFAGVSRVDGQVVCEAELAPCAPWPECGVEAVAYIPTALVDTHKLA